jgi:putative transposase
MLADKRYCYPLTISDFATRYLLSCEALSTTQEAYAFTVFERVFKEFGLPKAIRTDNGVPFASGHAVRLEQAFGMVAAAGYPHRAHQARTPQQNARHERMHLTLKKEATKAAAQHFSSSRPSSTTSSTAITTSGRTRRST